MTVKTTYGILLERADDPARYGLPRTIRIRAGLIRRDSDKQHPLNPPSHPMTGEMPPHLDGMLLGDLAMLGHVSDLDGNPFIGYEPEYYNRYNVDLRYAERMVKTLKHIGKRLERDAAYSAVDQFVSLCAALRLEFVVIRVGDKTTASYADNNWHWMTIAEGRNYYRTMIEKAQTEVINNKSVAA